jgi:hypothetical protein
MPRLHALAAAALAALLTLPPAALSATRTWASGDGSFFDASRWHQNLLPGSSDDIHIGNLAAAAGAHVWMGADWGVLFGSLHLSNGVVLDTNGSELVSFGTATLTGEGTRLIARPAPFYNQRDFQARAVIGSGAHLELRDNVAVNLWENSSNSGTLSGRGDATIAPGFVNNGSIRPGNNGGLTLRFGHNADWSGDLDGNGSGRLVLTDPFAQLRVEAASLTDSFSGQISMVHGALLDMQLTDGWTVGPTGRIAVLGFNNVAASQIAGSHLRFGGEMNVDLAEGKLHVLAPTTVLASARIDVGHSDELRFMGDTTVEGGSFALGRFGTLRFDGATTMSGGSFATHSTQWDDGTIAFNGPTAWRGAVTLAGTARQQGTAAVFAATTIEAQRFDMDGLSGTTSWYLVAPLTVRAEQIATTANNRFAGTIEIRGGLMSWMNMQLADRQASWIMSGTLRIDGLTPLVETKILGSRMVLEGQLVVEGGRVGIAADTRFSASGFAGPARVGFTDDNAELWMSGTTEVDAGVRFDGSGTLRNAGGGTMWLAHGADLEDVALVNAGVLHVGDGAALATAPAFAQLAGGRWVVELGGHAPGTEHDLLTLFGGGAQLGGFLNVALIDLGSGAFQPAVGDEFTILLAPGGVSGTFQNSPVSVAAGSTYHWNVLYRDDEVRLQLASVGVVPEPGTWALMLGGLIATGAMARRRRA